MPKNGLIQDFLENGSNDFAYIGNLNEPDDTLQSNVSGMLQKNLELELWSDSG